MMNTDSPGNIPVKDVRVAERACRPLIDINGAKGTEEDRGVIVKTNLSLCTTMLVIIPWLNMSPGGGHPKMAITTLKYAKVIANRVAGTYLSRTEYAQVSPV